MAKVIIRRRSTVKVLASEEFKVFMDGKLIGRISPSQKIECEVNEGKHLLVLESSVDGVEQEILVKEDTNSVEIVASAIRIFLSSKPVIRDVIIE